MMSQTNMTQAEKYLRKAIRLGLSMNHDLAMAKLQLAGIAMTKRRKREATTLMNEAKKLNLISESRDCVSTNYSMLKCTIIEDLCTDSLL